MSTDKRIAGRHRFLPGRLQRAVSSLGTGLKKLDNGHTYLILSAIIVTGWVKWVQGSSAWASLTAWILFAAIWIMVAADMFDFYLRKIHRRGRLLAEAGLL